MIDCDKVREERQDVLDLEQVAAGQAVHGLLDVLLLLHDVTSNLQPQLLPQLLVILWQVRTRLGQVHVHLGLCESTGDERRQCTLTL